MLSAQKTKSGFTIVELLIVIAVMVILSAIVAVAYSGVRGLAIESMLKSSLGGAAQKLESYNVTHSSYPDSLDDVDIIDTDTIKYQYSGPDDSNTFCLSVTSPQSKSKAFHVENGNSVLKGGVCEGHIGPDNEEEEGGEDHPFARVVKSGGPLSLTIRVGKEWNAAEISWTPQEGAKKYELQSRNPTGPNNNGTRYFQYRNINDGSGYCSIGINCTVGINSHAIPPSTTSLTWTDTNYGVPASAGQLFEYRMRYLRADDNYSEWEEVAMANLIQSSSDLPSPQNFTVTPNANYTNVTISWDRVPDFTPKMSEVYYEVQSRNPTGPNNNGTRYFQYRNINDGSGYCSIGINCTVGINSHAIPVDTTSLVWTNTSYAVPSLVGQSFEYQMRIRVSGEKTFYSEWSLFVLTH